MFDDNYRIVRKLTVFEQLDIIRKLAPAIGIVELWISDRNKGKPVQLPLVLTLSKLTDTNSQSVIAMCLKTVVRIDNGVSAPITTPSGDNLMYDDIDVGAVLDIVAHVIDENLGNFYRTALGNLMIPREAVEEM